MSNGRVEQVGSPEEVYEEPTTAYVADFLGVSNQMTGQAEGASGKRGPRQAGRLRSCWLSGVTRTHGAPSSS
jgi:ABC-type Fe3+/spermidine/putrescine transport system ATPase subunit